MDNISQLDINKAVQLLKDNLMFEVAKAIEEANIIPSLYVAAYVTRVHNELKNIENINDLETDAPFYHKLELYNIDDAKTKFKAVKNIITIAYERQFVVCDWNDVKIPKTKIGLCESEYHDEEKIPEKLTLLLGFDDSESKYDTRKPEYWCSKCAEDLESEGIISCDLEIE